MTTTSAPAARLPRQIPFIIGNEACERFSFYGMRNILVEFLTKSAILAAVAQDERASSAKEVFHIFVMGVYFFPLLGGWLSDRFLGKYRTIFWLSLVYVVGNLLLACFPDTKAGFYAGLFFISLGSGGIKPCVSAFVGEQFDQTNKHLAKLVFDAFYWSINFGSLFASWLIPLVLVAWGPRWAFGIPGLLMATATFIFWLGRKRYVVEPPKPDDPHSFSKVIASGLRRSTSALPKLVAGAAAFTAVGFLVLALVDLVRFLSGDEPYLGIVQAACLALVWLLGVGGVAAYMSVDNARGDHPDDDVDGVKAVLRVLVLFIPVTAFWSLFDQKASTWVLQGQQMLLPQWDLPDWAPSFLQMKKASQMQSVNPLLVMLLIPFNNLVVFPLLRKVGVEPTPLRRMTTGLVLASLSWIVIALLQVQVDGGAKLPILYQLAPYVILTLGEVLVSATGLEFAYSQAPLKMKSVLLAFWSLAVTVGGLWVLLVNKTVTAPSVSKSIEDAHLGFGVTAFQMFFFAGFAAVAALAFGLYAMRYRVVDNYRR